LNKIIALDVGGTPNCAALFDGREIARPPGAATPGPAGPDARA